MPVHLTCVTVRTPHASAHDLGVALRSGAPAGTAVRKDPRVRAVVHLESTTDAPDAAAAFVACGLAAAELVNASGLPVEVVEVVEVDAEGALCWVPAAAAP